MVWVPNEGRISWLILLYKNAMNFEQLQIGYRLEAVKGLEMENLIGY